MVDGVAWQRTIDELRLREKAHTREIDVVPILLGGGLRLFEHIGDAPIVLETTRAAEGLGRTHFTFRVVRQGAATD